MRRSLLAGISGILVATPLVAQNQLTGTAKWADSASREIEAATVASDLDRLTATAAMVDRVLTVTPNDPLLQYYRALAFYRSAAIYTGRKRNDDAKRTLDEANDLLEKAAAKTPTADALALRSAILGQIIGLSGNPLSGMRLGPKSGALMDRAKDLEPTNPRVWMLSGMSAIFQPKAFGGGMGRAEQELRKAIALFENDQPKPPAPSWGHADAYIWLGQVMQKTGKLDDARAAYQKALEIQPDNQWVQRVLLPSLETSKP
jgi:tetratricopeptide (TPR) repeat protein